MSVTQVRVNHLFIHAPNVHQGGGGTLLAALLQEAHGEVVLSVDARMRLPADMENNIQVKRIKPFIRHRLMAETWLARIVDREDVVLCFGNLPPLFKLRGRAVVFVQNRYLIEDVPLSGFPLKVRLRLAVERLWLTWCWRNVDEFVVQTPTMKSLLEIKLGRHVPVRVLPFVAVPDGYMRSLPQVCIRKDTVFDFVYVASGEPHKNHQRLIDAWCLLAEEGVLPSLCVTLDEARFVGLCRLIEKARRQYGIKITNVGGLSHNDALALLRKSGAAIYPSKFESFGLPLIEARQAGLPVLASELDYVRDVLDPEQVFDPDSSRSIARAVKRFMGKDEKPLPLLDAAKFWASIFERKLN